MSTSECLTRRAGVHGVQFASKIFQLYASFPRIRDLCVDHEYAVVKFHRISKGHTHHGLHHGVVSENRLFDAIGYAVL